MAHVTPPLIATPSSEASIDVELVAALLADQAPEFASHELRLGPSGWDNVLVHIGDAFAARLPRRQLAADISASELDWLPRVSAHWTFPAPVPVVVGQPGRGYPWRWSVVPWLDGATALSAPLEPKGAAALGAALAQVHIPAPPGAPLNPFRSQPLAQRRERFQARLELLEAAPEWRVDAVATHAAFDAADPWHGGTWCHLDIHGNNVLTRDGDLGGMIDWGDAGFGDAATDLGQARYMLGSEHFEICADAYRAEGGVGDPHSPRVRAEAINYAVTMATLDDDYYRASGWKSLNDLGVASEN